MTRWHLTAPTLVIPGIDHRHPTALAERLARVLPNGHLAPVTLTVDDFARAFAPVIRKFLATVART